MKVNIEKDLNKQQQQAVFNTSGPMIILAGAGSGKTRVLTYKVAYLIEKEKIKPENILMVTFTNKAANEMKERITKLVSSASNSYFKNPSLPYTGTFHSLCARILRKEGKYIGLPVNFVIYDEQDQKDAIRLAMTKLDLSQKQYHPNAFLSIISQAKNELISEFDYQNLARGYFQKIVAAVYRQYQELLRHHFALDFDDLLFTTIQLFRTQKDVLFKYQKQFRYLLVDEYQDTNHAQYVLTSLLGDYHKNVCAVGDASQSIYAWRGANYQNILRFQKDFPSAKVYYLEQNYRSTQNILDSAFSVISKNTTHPILKLWTRNFSGTPITVYEALNEQDETHFIINEILQNQYKFKETAILYRTNAQSRTIEEVLLHEGIPYVLVGGVSFYQRKEIKDLLSFLRFLFNPHDRIAKDRIEKIGKRRTERFFTKTWKNIDNLATRELLDSILSLTNYLDLFDKEDSEDFARLENIKELKSVAEEFPHISTFLENVALTEAAYKPREVKSGKSDSVTLMTMHAAKGLEFQSVFLVGMEEGLFPHSRSLLKTDELEEERRLCYVAMTRAKQHLYLIHARRRLYFGSRIQNIVSRFISDIPPELIKSDFGKNFI